MHSIEKAFTYRLYCPRKQVVKRAARSAFLFVIITAR